MRTLCRLTWKRIFTLNEVLDPLFGTMDDYEELLEVLKCRNIRLILDMVVNHVSNMYFWFKEACRDCSSVYRDYFVWKPADRESLPNNWKSFFGGSVWTKMGNEYYLHLFDSSQPDLNWENPGLRREMHNVMRFWMDRGVSGFRMVSRFGNHAEYREDSAKALIKLLLCLG